MSINPSDNAGKFDVITLGGQVSPGAVRFPQPPTRDEGWDVQAPSGMSGGWTIHHNTPPATFDLEIYVWKGEGSEGEQVDYWAEWDTWKAVLTTPIKRGANKALAIEHPYLSGLKPPITDVVVKSWTEPLSDGKGGGTAKISFIEYKPFRPNPVKALGGTTTAKSDPNQAARDQLAYRAWRNKNPGTSLLGSGQDLTFDDWVNAGRPQ